tara:strand:- start:713 stop:1261 length:549 start_codon:yes stop_codon:yes gene_type:complete
MNIYESSLKDVYVIEPKIFEDGRGYFLESFSQKEFEKIGLHSKFVQDNISNSTRGVVRGLHYQLEYPQGKLVRCLQGRVLDVCVDIRVGSPNFGKFFQQVLTEKNKLSLYIPPGFAHGFHVMSEEATFYYKCTDYYYPQDQYGIRWDSVDADWLTSQPTLSKKDTEVPLLSEQDKRLLPKYE